MRIFVTGAASPLGQALTRILVSEGHSVAGQIRRSAGIAVLRGLGAEPVIEDIQRPSSLIGVMEGCDLVFHLAHFFDFWAADASTYLGVNIRGTEAVMTSALVADVQRVVFCSTALAAADASRAATTEFARSMQTAEEIALRYVTKGMEVVVARPSIVLAPNDPGWAGRLVAGRVAGRRRFASRAPIGWIWVEDAARAGAHRRPRRMREELYLQRHRDFAARAALEHLPPRRCVELRSAPAPSRRRARDGRRRHPDSPHRAPPPDSPPRRSTLHLRRPPRGRQRSRHPAGMRVHSDG